jgi:hypothetical protein
MPVPQTGQPVVDYAPAEVGHGIPFIRPMRRWRSTCGLCFWAAAVGLFIWPPLAFGSAAAAIVCGGLAIWYMGRAARSEVDAGYAARQVVLAVILSCVLLLGVWLVPTLVESDLSKWRLVEERRQARA